MEYALYRLEKTKIAFENYCLIDTKLHQLTFNYSKFHAISYFVQYIWDYNSSVNYYTAYNKAIYKYLFKVFHNKTNKKKFELQIQQHNVHFINIIIIKDIVAAAKRDRKNKERLIMKNLLNKIAIVEVAKISNIIDHGGKYS